MPCPYLISHYSPRPATPWKLEFRVSFAGKRIRKFFATRSEAEGAGPVLAAQIRSKGTESLNKEDGISLFEILKIYRNHKLASMHGAHRRTAVVIFRALEEKFGVAPMDAILPLELEKWIHSRGKSPTTAATYYRYVRMFWRWAYKKQLIEYNLIERIDPPTAKGRLHILTPGQMRALLELDCPQWLRAAFVLCGFAGLRTEELLRMDWNAILHDEQSIHVARGVQKNSSGWTERYVDFTDPISRRAKTLQGNGKIIPVSFITFRRERTAAAKAIGLLAWPPNCLRHSFASYYLALHGDAGKTGHQMGHTSPAMVYRTYARAVRKSQSEAWWTL
jgi:integrase